MSDWWQTWADNWVTGGDPAFITKMMVYGYEMDYVHYKGDLMFERFTDRARRAVVLAQEEARLLGHDIIGTEHLLLGLIHEGEAIAAKALESLGVSLVAVRSAVEDVVHQGSSSPSEARLPFTPRAKKVFELSLREALQLGHNYIGTEHLLLALIREGEGIAAQVLVKLGVDLSAARTKVIELLSGYDRPQRPSVKLELSADAAVGLHDWLERVENLIGPFAEYHPARLLRRTLEDKPQQTARLSAKIVGEAS